jgi:hypothetical protein
MEECMICFDEKETFIFFPCNHKVCHVCFPLLVSYTNKCPLCNAIIEPLNELDSSFQLIVQHENSIPTVACLDSCRIYCMIFVCVSIIVYMFSFFIRYH